MTAQGEALARAARGLVGARFRLHGRDPHSGLDCVGLVAEAMRRCGHAVDPPAGYRLRQLELRNLTACLVRHGLHQAQPPIAPGDILLVRPAPAQFHLVLAGETGGFIHAHAALGKVVSTPGPLAWPIVHHWRLAAATEELC